MKLQHTITIIILLFVVVPVCAQVEIPYLTRLTVTTGQMAAKEQIGTSTKKGLAKLKDKLEQGRFVKALETAKQSVDFGKKTYGVGKMIYNTGVSAVEMVKRIGGDFEKLGDFQSYTTFFNLMMMQEYEQLNSQYVKYNDFAMMYENATSDLRTNGMIDPFKVAEQTGNGNGVSSMTLMLHLVQLDDQNRKIISARNIMEANALEKQAFELDRLANKLQFYISYTTLGADRETLNKWYESANAIGIGRGTLKAYRDPATGRGTFVEEPSALLKGINAPGDFLDSNFGKMLKSDLEKFKDKHNIPGNTIADYNKTINDYRFQASELRAMAQELRDEAYELTKFETDYAYQTIMANELTNGGVISERYGF